MWCVVSLVVFLQACATTASVTASDPRDPFENMNRQVTVFNDAIDAAFFKPVAKAYGQVVPSLVRQGVRNFFGNLSDVWSLANNAAQLKLKATGETALRLGLNTFLGFGGLLDIATDMGFERHRADFGLTLGHWGVPAGPYLVLPMLGPSTLRDGLTLPVDYQGDATRQFSDQATRNSLTAVRIVDVRASLLKTVDTVKEASLDPYSFVRDAYLQKRENDVHDGNPPSSFDYSDVDAQ